MTSVASPRVVNIEDLRQLARRRLPRVVFDYLDGGAEGEVTLRENRRAFDAVTFRPRHAVSVPGVDLRTAVLGRERAVRNGTAQLLGGTLRARLPFLPQLLTHPRWLASFLLGGGVPPLPNVVLPGQGPMPLVDVATALARAAVTWEDLRWLRDAW